MKTALFFVLAALAFPLRAQAPAAVQIPDEPHHRLVLENSYVRAWRFSLPAGEATLVHAHNLPYIAVSLGPADFANAVAGKLEVRGKTVDGQVAYSRGGFAHLVRADAGIPFNNWTIELLHPQGEPRNHCQKIVDAPIDNDCSSDAADLAPGSQRMKFLFETDDVAVRSFSYYEKARYSEAGPQPARLLIVGADSDLQIDLPGEATKSLHGGEILWIAEGETPTILTPGDNKVTRFFLLTFKTPPRPVAPSR